MSISTADTTATTYSPYRWVIMGTAWAAYVISIMDRQAWSNVAASVGGGFGLPVAALGVFVTAFLAGYVVSNAAGGVVADWIGPRRLISFALIPMGVFTFLFGGAKSVTAGIAIQLCMGLLAGADYAAGLKLVLSWFRRTDRGLATGIFMTATSFGVVFANAVVPTLMEAIGWQDVYRVLGGFTALAGVACFALLRDAPAGSDLPTGIRPDIRVLLRDRNLVLLSLAGFGALWGTWGFAFWANALMVRGHGVSVVDAGLVVASFGVGAIVAKPVIGFISDRLGGRRKLPALVCLVLFVATLLLFGQMTTLGGFRLVAPVLGVAAFVYSPMLNVMVAETAGRALAGSALGISNAIGQLGSTIVPLAVGAVYGGTGSFSAAIWALAVGPALAVLLLLPVQDTAGRAP